MNHTDFTKLRVILPQEINLDAIHITELMQVDVHDLEACMQFQPTLQASCSLLAREAERQLIQLKHQREDIEFRISREHKLKCEVDGVKFAKVDLPEVYRSDAKWLENEKLVDAATHAAKVMTSLEESLQQRYGMVQQIAKRRSNEIANLH